jgi:hypothetical protein
VAAAVVDVAAAGKDQYKRRTISPHER